MKPTCLQSKKSIKILSDSFDDFIDTISSLVVAEALKVTNGNRSQAAKLLSVSRPTLHAKIDKYNIKLKLKFQISSTTQIIFAPNFNGNK